MAQALSHIQVLTNAGHLQIPNLTKLIAKFGSLCGSPKKKLLLFIVTTIVGFAIVCVNYIVLKGPVIPFKGISGSGALVPHTSLNVPVSGLFCESFILSRLSWDNSGAAKSWKAVVYVVPEKPPYYDQYEFAIANDDITLDAANRWYMRYAHLHSGSEFTIKSCTLDGAQTPVEVCVLRGKESFKEWVSDLYSCKGSHMYGPYELNSCTENVSAQTLSSTQDHHFVVADSTYYFVHYAVENSDEVHTLQMNISISSLDYDYSDFNFSCTTGYYNSCSTQSIPLGLRGSAVITTVIEQPMGDDVWSYEDNIKVSWKCKPSFTGYILIFCMPILGLIGCCNLCNLCLALNNHYNCCNRIQTRMQDQRMPSSVRLAGHGSSATALSDPPQQQPTTIGHGSIVPAPSDPPPPQQQPSSQRDPQATIGDGSIVLVPSDPSSRQPSNTLQTPSDTAQRQPLDPLVESRNLNWNVKVVCFICFSNMTFLALTATFLEAILPVILYTTASNLVFTPGETRSFPIKKFLCSSLYIDVTGSSRLSASLWITEMDPQLTEFANQTIITPGDNFVCNQPKGCYEAWRSYMHPRSTLRVKADNHGNSVAYFRSFSTEDNFNNFLTHSAQYISSSTRIEVDKETEFDVSAGIGNQIFVLYSQSETRVKITLEFYRTEYSTNLSSLSHCELHSYTETNCKLPIPFGTGSVNGILQVTHDGGDSNNYSYFEYLTVHTNCNYRADSWTILWLPASIVNVIVFNVFIGIVIKLKYNRVLRRINIPAEPAVPPAQVAIGDSSDITATPSMHSQTLSPTLTPLVADVAIPESNETIYAIVEVHPTVEEGDLAVTTSETEPLLP